MAYRIQSEIVPQYVRENDELRAPLVQAAHWCLNSHGRAEHYDRAATRTSWKHRTKWSVPGRADVALANDHLDDAAQAAHRPTAPVPRDGGILVGNVAMRNRSRIGAGSGSRLLAVAM
jgi:hypothetical protein